MLWGNQPNQFNAGPSSKSQTMSPNLNYAELKSKPKNFNTTKNYPQLQMLAAPFQMPQTTIAPNNNLNQSTGINFMNNSFNNQNHFQIVSNQTYPENNNNNNDSFSKQENESFQSGRNTENFKSRKKSNNDLDSGKLDSSEIKENDRLRKIVMMENSEEKIENKHEEDESDSLFSFYLKNNHFYPF